MSSLVFSTYNLYCTLPHGCKHAHAHTNTYTHTHTHLTYSQNPPPFKADYPDIARLPCEDILGVTVVLLTCSYKSQEFVRVGYYVNNEYDNPEMNENPPDQPQYDKVCEFVSICSLVNAHTHTHARAHTIFHFTCALL